MKVRETGEDEFTIKLSRAEAMLLKTCAEVAEENDGRSETEWTQFAEYLANVLHHELSPASSHDCKCSRCAKV